MERLSLYGALKGYFLGEKDGGDVCPAGEHICHSCGQSTKKCEKEAKKIVNLAKETGLVKESWIAGQEE